MRQYWEKGYWCTVDDGSLKGDMPDILVFKPLVTPTDWKGERKAIREPTKWDYSNITAVEVETMLGGGTANRSGITLKRTRYIRA
ncbi:MAG: hypothetical protein QW314_01345 [Thermoproteota archaeon]